MDGVSVKATERREARVGLGDFSIYGSLLFLVFSVVGSILTEGLAALLVLMYVLIWALLISPQTGNYLKRPRIWRFLLSMILLGTLAIGGEKDFSIAGVGVSSEGVLGGIGMAVRAMTIVIATSAFARVVSIGGLSSLFARLGLGEIGFLLGIAMNLLPLIQSTSASVLLAMRLRGGFRRNRVKALKKMVVTILVNALRYSDDIVCAAESRAFGGPCSCSTSIRVTLRDGLFVLVSAAFYAALALLQIQLG